MPCDASASALQIALRSADPAPTPGRIFFAMESGGLPPDSGGSPRCRGERPLALALGIDAHLLDGRMDAVLEMGTAISPNKPFHFSLPPSCPPTGGTWGRQPAPTPPANRPPGRVRSPSTPSASSATLLSPIPSRMPIEGNSLSFAQRRALPLRSTPAAKRRGHTPWIR